MSIEKKSRVMMFPRIGKYIIIIVAVAFIIVGVRAYQLYRYVFEENVKQTYTLFIPEKCYF